MEADEDAVEEVGWRGLDDAPGSSPKGDPGPCEDPRKEEEVGVKELVEEGGGPRKERSLW